MVHQVVDGSGLVIKPRTGGQQDRARPCQTAHLVEMRTGKRSLSGNQNQWTGFLQGNLGGSFDEIGCRPGSDSRKSGQGTGGDDDSAHATRTGSGSGADVLVGMNLHMTGGTPRLEKLFHSVPKTKAKLLFQDPLGCGAITEVDLDSGGNQHPQGSSPVKGAAGAGDGQENSAGGVR